LNTLPEPKRSYISELLQAQALEFKDVDREIEEQLSVEVYDKWADKQLELESQIDSTEGIYFLYKSRRNKWRFFQAEGTDLSDESYRQAASLPLYIIGDLVEWELEGFRDQMPNWGKMLSRPKPYNFWTREELQAWQDQYQAHETYLDQ
jgi:hypothetical protein